MMQPNVGKTDRLGRIVLGLILLCSFVFLTGDARWIGLIGLVPIATSYIQWCPIYTMFGISTHGNRKDTR
jgi:hypothetical protein